MSRAMNRGVTFEAGGKSHLLRFDVNALCRIEEATGEDIQAAAARLSPAGGQPKLTDLRLLFWAGLGAGITREDAGLIMDDVGFDRIGEMIGQAFAMAFPDAPAGASDAGNGAGTASAA
jgi:hypothetical protein